MNLQKLFKVVHYINLNKINNVAIVIRQQPNFSEIFWILLHHCTGNNIKINGGHLK